jgi:hypothetical protein
MPKRREIPKGFGARLVRIVRGVPFWSSADVRVVEAQARGDRRAIQVFDAATGTKGFAGTREYRLLPLFSGRSVYWLGLEVTFQEEFRDVIVVGASIVVFRGSYAADKDPVLRAEWDSREDGGHAQPHWHVYPWAPVAVRTIEVRSFESAAAAISAEGPQFPEDLRHFHFAMSATWHTEPSGHQINLQAVEALGRWFSNCVRYVEGQLRYLESRAG